MAYNTTASLDRLTCIECAGFGKGQHGFGFLLNQNNSNYLDKNLKAFKKNDNEDTQLVQNLAMGEADLKQFMRLRNQLIIAAENLVEWKNCHKC